MKRAAQDLPLARAEGGVATCPSPPPADPSKDAGRPGWGASRPIRQLLEALDHACIRYCHWKSNVRLLESLSGDGDLDLLVHRQDALVFIGVLLQQGFKPAGSATGIGHPGVMHAFALDRDRARLVHVHAYFQLVSGDSIVKSYRLPLEEMLLGRTRRLHGVPVPSAEAELVAFILRFALKHASLLELLMLSRHGAAAARELAWLRSSANAGEAEALWKGLLPDAPVALFRAVQDAIAEPGRLPQRVRLGWAIHQHLQGWRRLGKASAAVSRFWRLLMLMLGRLRRRRALVPQASGIIVAFIGPKATGKSTLTRAVARRLGRHYRVRQVHVGKPPPTALTLIPRLALVLARRFGARRRADAIEGVAARSRACPSPVHALRLTILAYERRALLRRCWRESAAGSIVIADRYPSATAGASDSSSFEEADLAFCRSRVTKWLMQRERQLYANLPRPGLVIRLSAPIETALRRDLERGKAGGPNPAAVMRRGGGEAIAEYPGARLVTLDTDRPLEETVREAMLAVWSLV